MSEYQLDDFNGLQVVVPDPTVDGGKAINDNFKALATRLEDGPPDAADNRLQGFSSGSRWIDQVTGMEWVCTDAGSETDPEPLATWLPLGGSGAATAEPTANTVAARDDLGATAFQLVRTPALRSPNDGILTIESDWSITLISHTGSIDCGTATVTAAGFDGTHWGSGSQLTDLPASSIVGDGDLPDNVLSTNVPRKDATNTFGAAQTFNDGVTLSAGATIDSNYTVTVNTAVGWGGEGLSLNYPNSPLESVFKIKQNGMTVLQMREIGNQFQIAGGGRTNEWLQFFGSKSFDQGVGRIDFFAEGIYFFGARAEFSSDPVLSRTGDATVSTTYPSHRLAFQPSTWRSDNVGNDFKYSYLYVKTVTGDHGRTRLAYESRPTDPNNANLYEYLSILNGTDAQGASGGKVGINNTSPSYALDASNSSATGDVRGDSFIAKARAAAPPSPVNGQIYYDSDDHHFYGYANGTWKQLDN